MLSYSLGLRATYLSSHAMFDAPDPWRGGVPVTWTVNLYRLQNATMQHAPFALHDVRPTKLRANLSGGMQTLGIAAVEDGRYHMLPAPVAQLWMQGRLASEELPGLVHRVETGLALWHYPSWPRLMTRGMAWVCVLVGLVFLALGLALLGSPSEFGEGARWVGALLPVLGSTPAAWLWWQERGMDRTLSSRPVH